MSERSRQQLLQLLKRPGNEKCADCGASEPPPECVSVNLGVFLCIHCSGVHRSLGVHISIVKLIMLDTISEEKVRIMCEIGNAVAAGIWEHNVPLCWKKPTPKDHDVLIQQWIRAKYERQEFVEGAEDKQTYTLGCKSGILWKREKDKNNWNKRTFFLSSENGYLEYFIKPGDAEAKNRIHISNINVMLLSRDFCDKENCMLIMSRVNQGGVAKPRHLFVYSNSSFELVDWFLSIRAARLKFLSPYLYGVEQPVVCQLLSRPYLKMGYLFKTGSKSGDGWKKRFVCVDIHRFLYFDKQMASVPKGEVPIEEDKGKCFVSEGVDGSHPSSPHPYCFFVHTQGVRKGDDRSRERNPVFNFCSESMEDLLDWMQAFNKGMKALSWVDDSADSTKRFSLLSNISCCSSAS